MKKLLVVFMVLYVVSVSAQKKIKTLEVNDTITQAAIDRTGDFYLITKDHQIQKFDKNGSLLLVYKIQTSLTLFDPRDGSRLFAYYRKDQQYDYLNPSFEITSSYRIDSAFAIEPWLICPSGDYKLWVLDAADNSLKKINLKESEVEVEVIIDSSIIKQASSFITLREYQGFVFLLNPHKGIYIFNSLGKHIKTIETTGINQFNFLGEELYFRNKGNVNFVNLFSAESRQTKLEKPTNFVLFTDERQMSIGYKSVEIFEFKP
jgi:hypothetical protein